MYKYNTSTQHYTIHSAESEYSDLEKLKNSYHKSLLVIALLTFHCFLWVFSRIYLKNYYDTNKKTNLVVIHTYVYRSDDHSSQLYKFGVVLQFTVILMYNKKMFWNRDYEELDERGPFSNNKCRIVFNNNKNAPHVLIFFSIMKPYAILHRQIN